MSRKRVASLTSNILNPFLVSFIVIPLLAFKATSSTLDALKWALILVALSILPVLSIVVYLVRNGRLDGFFINVRRQRTRVYWLSAVCAGAGCGILLCFEAPLILIATFVAGLATVAVFMCINLRWKISVHTAFIAGSITVLVILYGWMAAIAAVLVPLMSWARIELKHHSPAQVATGALLATLIVVGVFYLFVLI